MGRSARGVPARLVPFGEDLAEPLALAREALRASAVPGEVPEHWAGIEEAIRERRRRGALWVEEGVNLGIGLWDAPGPLGVSLGMLYLRPAAASPAGYRALLEAIGQSIGPVAFAPSPLAGLSPEAEARTMRDLGYESFARSEMTYHFTGPVPVRALPAGRRVRPYRPEDAPALARIHQRAYEGQFDRYLFLEDLNAERDASALLRDLVEGRWGPFVAEASTVVEEDGRPVGSTLVVETPRGPLIADVATEPEARGRGVGRAALERTLAALAERGAPHARLAVTEENRRAVALYEKLGFVRTLGPAREWYHTARIPVAPGAD
jgi:ribosomal protein S18 acetylase RimI-like enzyme